MKESCIERKFKNVAGVKNTISSVEFERLMEDMGFVISRKGINNLARRKVIARPSVTYGKNSNGDRQFYELVSVRDTVAYMLAESVIGLKGRSSSVKLKLFRYAREALKETGGSDIRTDSHIRAFTVAPYFVPDDVSGNDRMVELRKARLKIEVVLRTLWFTNVLAGISADNMDLVDAWKKVRESVFSDIAIKNFARSFFKCLANDECLNVNETLKLIGDDKNLKDDMKYILEILMTFRAGTIILQAICEDYILKKYNIRIKLCGSPMWLIALHKSL